jgi:hypothetical protein
MSSLGTTQIPSDGVGQELTVSGYGVRLKSKNLTTTRSTTLKITGKISGAVYYVDVTVTPGEPRVFHSPAAGIPPSNGPRNLMNLGKKK